MIELLITCFPLLLRIAYLRFRKRPVTLYNVHRALFVWIVLFIALIFTVEYYHPDTRDALIPYRIVPVVTEQGGTVTHVAVRAGQTVKPEDLLFTVEDSSETAAVASAQAGVEEVKSQLEVAKAKVTEAKHQLDEAKAVLSDANLTLKNQEKLRDTKSPAYSLDKYLRAKSAQEAQAAEVAAQQSNVTTLQLNADRVLPSRLTEARARLNEAQVTLDKTRVHSSVAGRIEQLTLHVGDRAGQFVASPAMVIVPERAADDPPEIIGGFSQTNSAVLHVGMPAEVACESNINNGMKDTVLAARVTRIQDVISTGQIAPKGYLLQPSEQVRTGDLVVHVKLEYPEQQKLLIEGSRCLVQVYTTRISGSLAGTFMGGVIEAWALEKALIMRMKVWAMLFVGTGLGGGD
ncbi:biotin/lipoyl-binding protein [Labrenzia sp. 011]|uniref:HlyD family secretion protein n=1 Tax=Labrenzia sp. 011 TaxID=2171494 RepID=UPI001401DD4B|nr:biotin/lipoyl-binding protein [Labrenzia sp. 011]